MSASRVLPLALLQFNATVGDLAGNAARIVEARAPGPCRGRRLVVTPELALTGYPPEDLLLRPAFMRACEAAVGRIAVSLADLDGLHLVLGHPQSAGGGCSHAIAGGAAAASTRPRCSTAAS